MAQLGQTGREHEAYVTAADDGDTPRPRRRSDDRRMLPLRCLDDWFRRDHVIDLQLG